MNIPVLVMGFNRPELLRKCLVSLEHQGVRNLFISLDGPRTEEEAVRCNESLQVAESFRSSFNVKILSRTKNLGCYLGVVSNLDWFFSEVNFGIVIEDDCTVEFEFFKNVEKYQSLITNSQSSDVGMITAHNPFGQTDSVFPSEYSFIQGWAMHREVWQKVRPQLLDFTFPVLRFKSNRRLWENIYWWVNATRAKLGGVDTWDGAFSYAMFSLGLKCLVPAQNQINNFGFGLDATHTTDPNGSILIHDLPRDSKGRINDELLRDWYFRLKTRYVITSMIRLSLDFFRFNKRPDSVAKMGADLGSRLIR